jgi:hypothetical protein
MGFASHDALVGHFTALQPADPVITCDVCNKDFKNQRALDQHKLHKH